MTTQPILTERQLRRWYRLLSVPMTATDCGRLCAPRNGGIPPCCDARKVVPLLYRDEYRWHRQRSRFWRPFKAHTAQDRKLVADTDPCYRFAVCPGAARCQRRRRALVCRTFPFEPHVDRAGRVQGLVYQDERRNECPLIGRPRRAFNPAYIRNAIVFWQEVLDTLPVERELYVAESRKRRRRLRRQGRRVPVFR